MYYLHVVLKLFLFMPYFFLINHFGKRRISKSRAFTAAFATASATASYEPIPLLLPLCTSTISLYCPLATALVLLGTLFITQLFNSHDHHCQNTNTNQSLISWKIKNGWEPWLLICFLDNLMKYGVLMRLVVIDALVSTKEYIS